MAVKNWQSQFLTGQGAVDASFPLAATPRGGVDTGFTGESSTAPPADPQTDDPQAPQENLGPWLTDPDDKLFSRADSLVTRQQQIAINRLNQDIHFTCLKLGYPFSTLTKDVNRSTYRQSFPAGFKGISIQAVPNQIWDLCNKATETILVDPPLPDPTPLNDSEQAKDSAEMAGHFLTEDGGEQGTNDRQLFMNATDKALVCATSYIENWVDPTGGGYVPLQILAHPEAQNPAEPLIGLDGMPTTDPILRYVTAPDGGQFTPDPSQAAPQWQKKIRSTMWCREHWRIFPEYVTIEHAQTAIGILYASVGELKLRYPDTVGQMTDEQLTQLSDWTPSATGYGYIPLLPQFMRATWNITTGDPKQKAGTGDERIVFFYKVYHKADPSSPKGAEVVISGANKGTLFYKNTLSFQVDVPGDAEQTVPETRCMDIPLIQVTPRADPDDRDPTGRSYVELFAGAVESNATIATGVQQALGIWLNPASFIPSTSPVQAYQIQQSRASSEPILILKPEDKPVYENMPPIPPLVFEAINYNQEQIRSIAGLNKPLTGQDDSQEVSGKARQIAVQQGMVAQSRPQHPVFAAIERHWRVKLQLAQRDIDVPQQIRIVGEDGSYQVKEYTGTDFALVGGVRVAHGTGTMMPPEQKVNYLATIAANGMLDVEDAKDAANKIFRPRLGVASDPHQQFIDRCIASWLDGPPNPEWIPAWQQYAQAKAQADQAMQQFQQQQQAYQQAFQDEAVVGAGPPPQNLGPETQNDQAALAYSTSALRLQTNPLGPPPVQPQIQLPPEPWHPFKPRFNDQEPPIALRWMRALSKMGSTARFSAQPEAWQQPLVMKYQSAYQIVQQAQQTPPQGGAPKQGGDQAQNSHNTNPIQEQKQAQQGSQQPQQPNGVSG